MSLIEHNECCKDGKLIAFETCFPLLERDRDGERLLVSAGRRFGVHAEPVADFRGGHCLGSQHHRTPTLQCSQSAGGQMSLPAPLHFGFSQNMFHNLHHVVDPVLVLFAVQRPLALDRRANILPHSDLHQQRNSSGPFGHGCTDSVEQDTHAESDQTSSLRRIDFSRLDTSANGQFHHSDHISSEICQ